MPKTKKLKEFDFLVEVDRNTPERIKQNKLLNLDNSKAFEVTLTRENLLKNTDNPKTTTENEQKSPNGLDLNDWFAGYKKEAMVSIAGIRGPQNPKFHWDTRYPMNSIGIMLATTGKALVAKQMFPGKELTKICTREVRYNSKIYMDLISRVQAALKIKTLVTPKDRTMPIWLISFLIYKLGLYGGEYLTSSHSIRKKIATKDLNFQGSQFTPYESSLFISKIEKIFNEIKTKGSYTFKISARNSKYIDKTTLKKMDYGVSLYTEYLRSGVASAHNIDYIKHAPSKIIFDTFHGCMYKTMQEVFSKLGISESFEFVHAKEHAFFGGIGIIIDENGKVIDYGLDSSMVITDKKTNKVRLPVNETLGYKALAKKHPIGTICLLTDPDGDRLVTAEILPKEVAKELDILGIVNVKLTQDKILAVYMPNQSFLMNADFQMKSLKENGDWDKYNWFVIKTSASAQSWDEWAAKNNIPVVNTPVSFKEIASVMQKVEAQFATNNNVVVEDVFGKKINLGRSPRLLFGAEESGGEIFGSSQLIENPKGIKALAMREKSAGEATILSAAMYGYLSKNNMRLYQYLQKIFEENNIVRRFDVRVDTRYYNENEPDVYEMAKEKEQGMKYKEANEKYFLSLALGLKDKIIDLQTAKQILQQDFTKLKFDDLQDISFVCDGVFLSFNEHAVEVRPSGTDAVNKGYGFGSNKKVCGQYAEAFSTFDGTHNDLFNQHITQEYYNSVKERALGLLMEYQKKGLEENIYQP